MTGVASSAGDPAAAGAGAGGAAAAAAEAAAGLAEGGTPVDPLLEACRVAEVRNMQ